MFVYKIKSKEALLSHISFNNQYVTFWQNPIYNPASRLDDRLEFITLEKELEQLLLPGHQAHSYIHSNYHRNLKLNHMHYHNVLKNGMTDNVFKEFITLLQEHNSKAGLENRFQALPNTLKKMGLPKKEINQCVKKYDVTLPCIPTDEIPALHKTFQNYQKSRKAAANVFKDHLEKWANYGWEIESWVGIKDQTSKRQLKKLFDSIGIVLLEVRDGVPDPKKIQTILNTHKNTIKMINAMFKKQEYIVDPLDDSLKQLQSDIIKFKAEPKSLQKPTTRSAERPGKEVLHMYSRAKRKNQVAYDAEQTTDKVQNVGKIKKVKRSSRAA